MNREAAIEKTVAEAVALRPELVKRGAEFDELRQLPQDIAERMAGLGFYRLCAPTGAGGLDLGARGMAEVVEALAMGNGSAAWCAFIASTSHINVAGSHPSVRKVLAADADLKCSGVFAPSGTALAAEQDGRAGYVVNGHWRWGSGSRNADWISSALTEVDASGERMKDSSLTRVWLRPGEAQMVDNWHVSGLRGSGSGDYVAESVWVPAERAVVSPEESPFADEPVFRFPRYGLLASPIGAIALGMAQASVDEAIEQARVKKPKDSRRTLAERPKLHHDLAVHQTRLLAARALFYAAIDDVWAKAADGSADVHDRLAVRTATWHAVDTSVDVIDKMYSMMGGTSVFETSPLQRHFRDVHVASQHMMLADSVMELAGRVLIGLDEKGVGL